MVSILTKPDVHEKLRILSGQAQYDLACACGSGKDEHRVRSSQGNWIYPVTLANGGKASLFRTLISNACANDCKYCPLREDIDTRRVSLSPDETAETFLDYYDRGKVFGMFLTSGLIGTADNTMDRLTATAEILRKRHKFRGHIHLKIIPGASPAAVYKAVSLASSVSLNIETPGQEHLRKLSGKKDFLKDIIEPIKLISKLTAKGQRHSRVKQTTQFIVGASDEKDSEILKYMTGLYDRLKMHRVFFSAYQKGLGDSALPAENTSQGENPHDRLTREHRLYQADYLLRKYRFSEDDFTFCENGNLSLEKDPKQLWAENHPEFFPLNVNKASKFDLLKVPGLGPITVRRILKQRKQGRITSIEDIGRANSRLLKANGYLYFS